MSTPFSSWHGTLVGGIWLFPVIRLTVIRQKRMCYLQLERAEHEDKHA